MRRISDGPRAVREAFRLASSLRVRSMSDKAPSAPAVTRPTSTPAVTRPHTPQPPTVSTPTPASVEAPQLINQTYSPGAQQQDHPRYTLGKRAGELYSYKGTSEGMLNTMGNFVTGKSHDLTLREANEAALRDAVDRAELMHAELADATDPVLKLRRVAQAWMYPLAVVLGLTAAWGLRPLVDPQRDHQLRVEETKRFIQTADKLETLKVDNVLDRITLIEKELQKRGVETPKAVMHNEN